MAPRRRIQTEYRELIAEDPGDLFKFVYHVHGPSFIFRGQANAEWGLETSIEREYGRPSYPESQENRLIQEFQRGAHNYLDYTPRPHDYLEWLAILQHYGAPTRLLDFTQSVFVAAFFATCYERPKARKPAAIWAMNVGALQSSFGDFIFDNQKTLMEYSDQKNFTLFQSDGGIGCQLDDLHPPLNQFNTGQLLQAGADSVMSAALTGTLEPKGLFPFQPKRMDTRMKAQKTTFVAPINLSDGFIQNLETGLGIDLNSDTKPEHLQAQHLPDLFEKVALAKVIIPPHALDNFRWGLRQMNLTHDTLFPGLEGFTRSLIPEPYAGLCLTPGVGRIVLNEDTPTKLTRAATKRKKTSTGHEQKQEDFDADDNGHD